MISIWIPIIIYFWKDLDSYITNYVVLNSNYVLQINTALKSKYRAYKSGSKNFLTKKKNQVRRKSNQLTLNPKAHRKVDLTFSESYDLYPNTRSEIMSPTITK